MMARFCGYIDKVFEFRRLTAILTDSRPQRRGVQRIPRARGP
jgi:hypothetical protein